jgi:putative endonuclease
MKKNKKKTYQKGLLAEFAALILLKLKGYKILARRYKTFLGEIDIIAQKKNCLIAIEVKLRKSINIQNGFLIDEVVTKNQRERIKRTINSFIKSNYKKYSNQNVRFDLVVISPYKLPHHFINFWE